MIVFSAHRNRGSALIAVFWLIAILGMVVFGTAKFVSLDSHWISGQRKASMALREAESGLAIGRHPLVVADDPILKAEGRYVSKITTEEGLIPINVVLSGQGRAMVKRLFRLWGVAESDAAAVTDALTDWIDTNDLVSLNGAERDAYEVVGRSGMPFNQPFSKIAEMRFVIGMEKIEAANPNWASWFTVYSSGKFDLNEAGADSISAVLGSPIESARAAIARRDGPDGIKFVSVAQALQTLGAAGVTDDSNFFTVQGTTRRVVSDGFFDDTHQRLVEVRGGGGNLLWRGKFTGKTKDFLNGQF